MKRSLTIGAIRMTTLPGPLISRAAGQAVVSRLRSGVLWAKARIVGELEGDPEEAAELLPQLSVVDRWRLLDVLELDYRETDGVTLAQFAELANNVLWYWSPSYQRIFLVAPNVWSVAAKLELDEADFAKWIALEALLTVQMWWGLDQEDPDSFTQAQEMAAEKMRAIEPRELTSVYWLREHLLSRRRPWIPSR